MKALLTITLLLITFAASAQRLTSADRTYWNGYVNYLETKGLKGSALLDSRSTELSKKMFNTYSKEQGRTIDYTFFVTLVQVDIAEYRTKALSQIHSGKATFAGADSEFMSGLSVIDGWAGSKTTSYKFPSETVSITNVPNNLY